MVTGALADLRSRYEVVVIEGAGSPAEINLAGDEIVNMRVARHCGSSVLLVGDIDRGGVFASLVGTLWLLPPEDARLIKALVINKFRGDRALLEPGLRMLEARAGVPVAGVVPYFDDIHIAAEDSVTLERPDNPPDNRRDHALDIAVVRLPRISNFDDFDPLRKETGVRVRYVESVGSLGAPDLVILPGSKTTAADLEWLYGSGLARRIKELHARGAFIIGICGGYQMLGKRIDDPHAVESGARQRTGLGLLPVSTVFATGKETHQVRGETVENRGLLSRAGDAALEGYEIHMGRTEVGGAKPVFRIRERSGRECDVPDGCMDGSGRVLGTYIHGLFHNEELRRAILEYIAQQRGRSLGPGGSVGQPGQDYDRLAGLVRGSLDMGLIYRLAGLQAA